MMFELIDYFRSSALIFAAITTPPLMP